MIHVNDLATISNGPVAQTSAENLMKHKRHLNYWMQIANYI